MADLNERGLKASRITRMARAERQQAVQDLASGDNDREELLTALKIAMLTLDGPRFRELLAPGRGTLRMKGVPSPEHPRTRVFLGIAALMTAVAALPAR